MDAPCSTADYACAKIAYDSLARSKVFEKAELTPPSATKVRELADQLARRLMQGDIPLRKAHLRAFIDEVVVGPQSIHIGRRKDILAIAATKGKNNPEARVPTLEPEWRPLQESNLRHPT